MFRIQRSLLGRCIRYRNYSQQQRVVYVRFSPSNKNSEPPWMRSSRNYAPWLIVAGLCATYFYYTHLETIPFINEQRFVMISPALEEQLGKQTAAAVQFQYRNAMLPADHFITVRVAKVAKRLIDALPQSMRQRHWRLFVIDAPVQNAFVTPGGHIFVYTGILEKCTDDDSLATVLGHEISHVLLRHAASRMSWGQVTSIAMMFMSFFMDIHLTQVAYKLFMDMPFSRKQELEADEVGLQIMASACFDYTKAPTFWARMQEGSGRLQPASFLSTHPSHHSREKRLRELMPKAREAADQAQCEPIFIPYWERFRDDSTFRPQ